MMVETRRRPSRLFAVNPAEWMSFAALGSLILQPLLGSLAAAGFLLSGISLAAFSPRQSLQQVAAWWPMLLLPAYCLLSTLWSQYPDETLRYALQLAATLGIAVLIAAKVKPPNLLTGLFLLFSVGVILCFAIGRNQDGRAWLGIFASKNAFAGFVVLYAVLSAGVLLDGKAAKALRAAAAVGLAASALLLLRAESTGALLEIIPVLMIVAGVVLSRRLSDAQMTFVLALLAILAAALLVVGMAFSSELLDLLLNAVGKDTTLTGRTDLWSIGLSTIAESPWLGVGYRAFWVEGYGPAEELWAMFQLSSGAGFSFHNLYISNAVELGLVGLALQIALIYVPLAALAWLALMRPDVTTATLLGLQCLLVVGSVVEVGVFFEFSLRSVLAYVTAIYAIEGLAAQRAVGTARHGLAEPA